MSARIAESPEVTAARLRARVAALDDALACVHELAGSYADSPEDQAQLAFDLLRATRERLETLQREAMRAEAETIALQWRHGS